MRDQRRLGFDPPNWRGASFPALMPLARLHLTSALWRDPPAFSPPTLYSLKPIPPEHLQNLLPIRIRSYSSALPLILVALLLLLHAISAGAPVRPGGTNDCSQAVLQLFVFLKDILERVPACSSVQPKMGHYLVLFWSVMFRLMAIMYEMEVM